jgi:uncharacterized protein involved in exopolysaccharide biosynthesis
MSPVMNSPTNEPGQQAFLILAGEQSVQARRFESRLLPLLLDRWRLIAAVSLLFAFGAVGYCLSAAKWYRAQVLMAAVQPDLGTTNLGSVGGGLGGIAALAGIDLNGGDSFKKEFVARFSSRAFTYRFLTEEGLIPILFSRKWDTQQQRWKSTDPDEQPTLEQAYQMFNGKIRMISEDRRNGLIKVTVDWKDPLLAKDWANKLVARFNADARDVARDESQRSLEYLNRELARTDIVELRQTISGLIESETRKAMLATVREQYAFKIVDPAFVPGKEGLVWPRPVVLVTAALVAGALLGALLALGLASRQMSVGLRPKTGRD